MKQLYLALLFLLIILLFGLSLDRKRRETFETSFRSPKVETRFPRETSFRSPKSNLKNYNQTVRVTRPFNSVEAHGTYQVGHRQPKPDWIYPYTFLNRRYLEILLKTINQIEMEENGGQLDPEFTYPSQIDRYQTSPNDQIVEWTKEIVDRMNRHLSLDPPIIGLEVDKIKYLWINPSEVYILAPIYKRYTACDIKYVVPKWNQHLKRRYNKTLIIHLTRIDGTWAHLRHLRFWGMRGRLPADLSYAGTHDQTFHLATSKTRFLPSDDQAKAIYYEWYLKKYRDQPGQAQCFGVDTYRDLDTPTMCHLEGGVWDRKCTQDSDCPYYQANQNYPNKLGGCDRSTGYCRWPEGVQAKTYRQPLNPEDAICYNCLDGTLGRRTPGKCCPQQKSDTKLKSPDYAFPQDMMLRFNYRNQFKEKELNWYSFQ